MTIFFAPTSLEISNYSVCKEVWGCQQDRYFCWDERNTNEKRGKKLKEVHKIYEKMINPKMP